MPSRGIVLVMEHMSEGTLAQALARKENAPPLVDRIGWLRDICAGMEVLHSRNIMHRSLKSSNVLLKGRLAKVGNFSKSKATSEGNQQTQTAFASNGYGFKPPEEFPSQSNSYNGRFFPASDVYSFAMISYHSAAMSEPFAGMKDTDILTAVRDDERRPALKDLCAEWPAALRDFMCMCWAEKPRERPSFTEAKRMLANQLQVMAAEAAAAETGASDAATATAAAAAVTASSSELRACLAEILALKSDLAALAQGQTAIREDMCDLKDDVSKISSDVKANETAIIKRVEMLARRITTAGFPKCPWLFAICPDKKNDPSRLFKKPKAWLKKELRIHLLCNGRRDLGVPPHFLYSKEKELEGLYRGYRILEASEKLKKWAPVIKFVLAFLSLAAKAAASAFIPGIGGAIGVLLEMGEVTDFAIEEVQSCIGNVCDSVIKELDHECGTDATSTWSADPDAAFHEIQADLANYIIERDKLKHRKDFGGREFFGLKMCQNSKVGAGDGQGAPIWLCPDCLPKTVPDELWSGASEDLKESNGPGKLVNGEVRRISVDCRRADGTLDPIGIQLRSLPRGDDHGYVHIVDAFDVMQGNLIDVVFEREAGQELLGIDFGASNSEIVVTVTKGSIAERKGVRVGDIVTAVEGDPTSTPLEVLKKYPKNVAITLKRGVRTPAEISLVTCDDILLEISGERTSGKTHEEVVQMLASVGADAELVVGKARPPSTLSPTE